MKAVSLYREFFVFHQYQNEKNYDYIYKVDSVNEKKLFDFHHRENPRFEIK